MRCRLFVACMAVLWCMTYTAYAESVQLQSLKVAWSMAKGPDPIHSLQEFLGATCVMFGQGQPCGDAAAIVLQQSRVVDGLLERLTAAEEHGDETEAGNLGTQTLQALIYYQKIYTAWSAATQRVQ